MQTQLAPWARDSAIGQEADAILRRCVHCGFCSATCPSYQILGDELDSPRGRIYLIKQVLEGESPSRDTQLHLDRCLTCHNCESTCPSGVEYGRLLDIGRKLVDERVTRSWQDKLKRSILRKGIQSSWFAPALRIGQWVGGVLPGALRRKIPVRRDVGRLPVSAAPSRQVLMLTSCVQGAMMPTIDAATLRVLDAIGISAHYASDGGCCGAVNFHLNAQDAALSQMKANVDAWWPLVESGVIEAIVMNASGCGALVKEYAHHLRHEPAYSQRAERIVALLKDIAEIVAPHTSLLRERLSAGAQVAFHPPCTLQHWQGLRPLSEKVLVELGFELLPFPESHLCCGSAGTYSVLNPEIALALRNRKLDAITPVQPAMILSSNMGCIGHLQSGTQTPVRHWIEAVDERLSTGSSTAS